MASVVAAQEQVSASPNMDGKTAASTENCISGLRHIANQFDSVKDDEGFILSEQFLKLQDDTIAMLETFGNAFLGIKQDIKNNTQRLRKYVEQDPVKFKHILSIVDDEIANGKHSKGDSSTCAILWLKRAYEFLVALLDLLLDDDDIGMKEAVQTCYEACLKPFHGWLLQNAFGMGFQMLPNREDFIKALKGHTDCDVKEDARHFTGIIAPILTEIHLYLDERECDFDWKV